MPHHRWASFGSRARSVRPWATHAPFLAEFIRVEAPAFIPCDRRALDSAPIPSARKTTDIYLADLAAARGWRFATLNAAIVHPAVDPIPEIAPVPDPP